MTESAPNAIPTALEEMTLNAWPAAGEFLYDGWILRFSRGDSVHANCVHPLYAGGRSSLLERVQLCEGMYAAQNLPVRFKLNARTQPRELDALLAQRGYQRTPERPVHLLALPERQLPARRLPGPGISDEGPDQVYLTEELTDRWLAALGALRNLDTRNQASLADITQRIVSRCCYVSIASGDQPVAAALGVLQQNCVGILELRARAGDVSLQARLLGLLLDWAADYEIKHAYTSVTADAQLLARVGFREVYRFWFRERS